MICGCLASYVYVFSILVSRFTPPPPSFLCTDNVGVIGACWQACWVAHQVALEALLVKLLVLDLIGWWFLVIVGDFPDESGSQSSSLMAFSERGDQIPGIGDGELPVVLSKTGDETETGQ